jgi:hypothetical protein
MTKLYVDREKGGRGGHCFVAWPVVIHPKELGGLGIADLKMLGWALRVI